MNKIQYKLLTFLTRFLCISSALSYHTAVVTTGADSFSFANNAQVSVQGMSLQKKEAECKAFDNQAFSALKAQKDPNKAALAQTQAGGLFGGALNLINTGDPVCDTIGIFCVIACFIGFSILQRRANHAFELKKQAIAHKNKKDETAQAAIVEIDKLKMNYRFRTLQLRSNALQKIAMTIDQNEKSKLNDEQKQLATDFLDSLKDNKLQGLLGAGQGELEVENGALGGTDPTTKTHVVIDIPKESKDPATSTTSSTSTV